MHQNENCVSNLAYSSVIFDTNLLPYACTLNTVCFVRVCEEKTGISAGCGTTSNAA